MPHFSMHVQEEALDGAVAGAVILALTEAVVRVYGERARPLAVVELFGVPRERWGAGGRVAPEGVWPVVTLNMREPALAPETAEAAPARLIDAITDGLVGVFGEDVRATASVQIIGIPTGRSGVAGDPV
jgi:phenylpyruvate tautomerase PptA (4-oxalocrotonate tautomerase family)